ncbi:hypothetical protein SAMN05661096_00095 [Marivirga sericea]|uniref:Uncharacterized protein n=1 Tax=Marivirga sericea TaxID=1028 RepID=A0A1X7I0M3_9BACT|nr:hypothetical protein [Marivirga sericea]SMG07933.1 hypothetical protein SAMN05661096_00095 [Marivirga sericea]
MKTSIFAIFITILTFGLAYSQNAEQEWSLRKSYTTQVDLVVKFIEGANVKQRTAKAGLKYRYIETINNSVYIKFLDIKSSNDPFRDDDNFVNSTNDEIKYFIDQDDLTKIHKKKNASLVSGTLLAPIKIRPEEEINGETVPWELSTDLTLGQYIGFRLPISKTNAYYLTVPTVTLGTSLLSINSSNTNPETETSTTLGLTWSLGVLIDLNGFNIGMMLGRDYAPGSAGKDWIYNEKTWFSLGFGINLTSKNRDL